MKTDTPTPTPTPTRASEKKALDVEYRKHRQELNKTRGDEDAQLHNFYREAIAEIQQRYSYDTYIVNLRTTQYEDAALATATATEKL